MSLFSLDSSSSLSFHSQGYPQVVLPSLLVMSLSTLACRSAGLAKSAGSKINVQLLKQVSAAASVLSSQAAGLGAEGVRGCCVDVHSRHLLLICPTSERWLG